ncbi:YraN family protein [Motiliproteus sp. SC1-56]|uniref:YraN family protein n=1 Tax=Motiliproteus sp. SC1-56 TaxID=2799565 RepID=UPI001A8F655D|nr:YraN family protein [Motiliproteus sp. SC1-56]
MSITRGAEVEAQALAFLERQGARLVSRNYRARGGEIDLIVILEQVLVFVEVRFRSNSRYDNAAESVDYRKQQRLALTAQRFLQDRPDLQDTPCRFDVLACHPEAGKVQTHWIIDAFQP